MAVVHVRRPRPRRGRGAREPGIRAGPRCPRVPRGSDDGRARSPLGPERLGRVSETLRGTGGESDKMTKVTVKVPTPLRPFTGGHAEVAVEGSTVGGLVRELRPQHPGLQRHLFTPDGKMRSFVTVYLNDEDVRYLQKEATPVKEGDVVSIVPGNHRRLASVSPLSTAREPDPHPRRADREVLPEEPGATAVTSSCPRSGWPRQRKLRRAKVLIVGAGGLGGSRRTLPCRGRCGGDRSRRFRRGRPVEPPAPGPLHHARRRSAEARGGQGAPRSPEPGRHGRAARRTSHLRQCARRAASLRHRDRRDRQLPYALPRQRCGGPPRQTERLRFDLPLRRTGERLRRPAGSLLPLPLPRTPASRPRPVVRGGRGPRRAARSHRRSPGNRDGEADPRHRHVPRRPACCSSMPSPSSSGSSHSARTRIASYAPRTRPRKGSSTIPHSAGSRWPAPRRRRARPR